MAQYTNEVIVLGTKNRGDADKLLRFFSREAGKITAMAYGARRARSQVAGSLQLFNRLEVTLSAGERIETVRACRLIEHPGKVTEDLTAMAYASFVAELVLELSPDNEPQPEMFDELVFIIRAFREHNPRIVALSAAFKLLALSGLSLELDTCINCGKPIEDDALIDVKEGGAICKNCGKDTAEELSPSARELIKRLTELNLERPEKFSVKGGDLLAAEKIMLDYLPEILGKKLKALDFISKL